MGADIALEVAYVHGKDVNSLPSSVRVPPMTPSIDDDGRKVLQLGRHSQQQWFEAMLEDPVHRNSVSRVACEICWGGPDNAAPTLRTLGSNLLVVDERIVTKDQVAHLGPASQIRFMFQSDTDLADLLMLVVHPIGSTSVLSQLGYNGGGGQPVVASQSPTAEPGASIWRLELVYGAGLSPEAFMGLSLSTRTFCFALSPSKPSVVLGRQHQMAMFEALLQSQKELLAFVSRSHLQLELSGDSELLVTNLSQNISIAQSANILLRGSGIKMASGDVISFAAQAEMVPGIDATTIVTGDGVERELAPFLTFRLVKSQASPVPSSSRAQ